MPENVFQMLKLQINKSISSKYITSTTGINIYDPITLENTNDSVVTTCNHSFDKKMIIEWIAMKRNCPICRFEFY